MTSFLLASFQNRETPTLCAMMSCISMRAEANCFGPDQSLGQPGLGWPQGWLSKYGQEMDEPNPIPLWQRRCRFSPRGSMTQRPNLLEHCRNGRFFNPGVAPLRFSKFVKWITHRRVGPWRRFVASVPGDRPLDTVSASDLRVTFINHATVLLQTEGCNFITDPIWSE